MPRDQTAPPVRSGILLAQLALTAGCGSDPSAPNIVLIVADDLGYGHLGCYGQTSFETPRLDQMSREGTRYTQAYAGSPVCAPSRSTLMTGLHTGHTSVRVNGANTALLDGDITIAEVLRSAGYVTGMFGKWGLGDADSSGAPWHQGFDEFYGQLDQVHAHFHYPLWLWRGDQRESLPENANGGQGTYAQDRIVDEALGFIDRHRDRRFFLYLPLPLPHMDLAVPEDSVAPLRGRFGAPRRFTDATGHYVDCDDAVTTVAAMVSRLDRDVGRILDRLTDHGVDRRTLVVVTSDNGTYRIAAGNPLRGNGGLRGYKGQPYEGGIRVPALAWWPGRVPAGRVDDLVWANWDLLPTVAEIASATPPVGLDGQSFAARLMGSSTPLPDRVLYWGVVANLRGGPTAQAPQAVRFGQWKAVRWRPDGPPSSRGGLPPRSSHRTGLVGHTSGSSGRYPPKGPPVVAALVPELGKRHQPLSKPLIGISAFDRSRVALPPRATPAKRGACSRLPAAPTGDKVSEEVSRSLLLPNDDRPQASSNMAIEIPQGPPRGLRDQLEVADPTTEVTVQSFDAPGQPTTPGPRRKLTDSGVDAIQSATGQLHRQPALSSCAYAKPEEVPAMGQVDGTLRFVHFQSHATFDEPANRSHDPVS